MKPNSEPEPISQQRDTDLIPHAIVETTAEKVIEKPGSVRLISEPRVQDEKLQWLKAIIAGENLSYVPADFMDLYRGGGKIFDAEGVAYDGILHEDGTVDEGWFTYHCPKTFEYFNRPKDEYRSQAQDTPYEPSFVYLAETIGIGRMHYFLTRQVPASAIVVDAQPMTHSDMPSEPDRSNCSLIRSSSASTRRDAHRSNLGGEKWLSSDMAVVNANSRRRTSPLICIKIRVVQGGELPQWILLIVA
jgi:hypothetical protein